MVIFLTNWQQWPLSGRPSSEHPWLGGKIDLRITVFYFVFVKTYALKTYIYCVGFLDQWVANEHPISQSETVNRVIEIMIINFEKTVMDSLFSAKTDFLMGDTLTTEQDGSGYVMDPQIS